MPDNESLYQSIYDQTYRYWCNTYVFKYNSDQDVRFFYISNLHIETTKPAFIFHISKVQGYLEWFKIKAPFCSIVNELEIRGRIFDYEIKQLAKEDKL